MNTQAFQSLVSTEDHPYKRTLCTRMGEPVVELRPASAEGAAEFRRLVPILTAAPQMYRELAAMHRLWAGGNLPDDTAMERVSYLLARIEAGQ